ncbi:MAG: hypothetical protein KDD22_00380 [Bdellovibrionales bacterium]|nr:hypothetical protein [Bdellovibrionales bacterium]
MRSIFLLLASFVMSSLSYGSEANLENLRAFKGLLREHKTIEDVIEHLPASLLKNYTLMRTSESLQDASPVNPRALLYGYTGRLIVSFNGHSDQRGYGALEVASFDEKTKRIQYREFSYTPNLNLNNPVAKKAFIENEGLESNDIEGQIGNFVVTKPNPNKCLQCHALNQKEFPFKRPHSQRLARYIWFQYNSWAKPGGVAKTYGVHDDSIRFIAGPGEESLIDFSNLPKGNVMLKDLKFKSVSVDSGSDLTYLATEASDYVKFRKARIENPRYKHLVYDSSEFLGFPFHGRGNGTQKAIDYPNLTAPRLLYDSFPNLRLAHLLAANFTRQMRSILSQDSMVKRSGALVVLNHCLRDGNLSRTNTSVLGPIAESYLLRNFPDGDLFEDGAPHNSLLNGLSGYLYKKYGDIATFDNPSPSFEQKKLFIWGGNSYHPLLPGGTSYLYQLVVEDAIAELLRSSDTYQDFLEVEERDHTDRYVAPETAEYLQAINLPLNLNMKTSVKDCNGFANKFMSGASL